MINGPLHSEQMGPRDRPAVVFVHPNPMDSSCWIYQLAHLSTWYRTIAVDLPGYGRSPAATADLTMIDVARAVWDAVDRVSSSTTHALVGCSVGANVVQHMYHLRPDEVACVVLSGTGFQEPGKLKPFAAPRIAAFEEQGLDFRHSYTLQDFSSAFAETPMARWFAQMFVERNSLASIETIIHMFRALGEPDPEWLQSELRVPVLILGGSEDASHQRAAQLAARFPDARISTIAGGGHAVHMEQPWEYDERLLAFFRESGFR